MFEEILLETRVEEEGRKKMEECYSITKNFAQQIHQKKKNHSKLVEIDQKISLRSTNTFNDSLPSLPFLENLKANQHHFKSKSNSSPTKEICITCQLPILQNPYQCLTCGFWSHKACKSIASTFSSFSFLIFFFLIFLFLNFFFKFIKNN